MTAAALGTSMGLQTLHGVEDLDIQPGTQSGTVITLRGQGMPRLRCTGGSTARHLHVHIESWSPDQLDARQAELLRELATLRGEEQPELGAGTQRQASSPASATRSSGDSGRVTATR